MDPRATGERFAAIERRLTRIENALQLSPPPPQSASAQPSLRQSDAAPKQSSAPKPPAKPGNWLGMIAVACFVLAAGFIVKLSIESGWLTPARQIGLAVLLGFTLIGAGFTLMRSDRSYASLLPGAGLIVLYLAVFAAHGYYDLISFELAIGFTGVVSSVCIWLYTQIRHDAYAITAAVGAYIAPVILDLNTDAMFSIYYFLLCSVAFATISVWVRSRTLTLVSSYLAILMSGYTGAVLQQEALIATLLALHFAVFAVGSYLYTTQHRTPLTTTEAWAFLPVLLLFYVMEYHLIDAIHPGMAPWVSLGFAGVLIGLYLSAKKYFPDGLGSQTLVFAFTTLVCFHSIYLELLPDDFRPWLFVLIMAAVMMLPFNAAEKRSGGPWRVPILAILAILAIEYLSMLSHLMNGGSGKWLLVSFAALASIWAVLTKAEDKISGNPTYGHTLLGAAHLLAVLGLYRLTEDIGSLAVSASWLFYAVGVLMFSFMRKDEVMAKSALFVLAFAAGKALLYDAASAPTVLRIVCLLLTGAVLYGCGLFMRRIGNWTTPPQ